MGNILVIRIDWGLSKHLNFTPFIHYKTADVFNF